MVKMTIQNRGQLKIGQAMEKKSVKDEKLKLLVEQADAL